MKKKLLLFLTSIMLLAGCVDNGGSSNYSTPSNPSTPESVTPSNDDSTSLQDKITYQIIVTDIDGEQLGSKYIAVEEGSTVFNDLVSNFDVDYTTSEYGPYLSSINGSVIDSNYYLAIYENGEAAATGVDGLVADSDDVFEFKVECWNTISSGYGTLDEYDLLVDKAIYGYMKQLDLSTSETFADSTFWDLMTINLARNNYYDSNLFSFDSISQAVKDELNSYDLSTLSGANLYKYYLYNKALGKDMAALKEVASTYIETLDNTYNSYVTPFIVAAAKGLEIESEKITTLTSAPISTDLKWGPDVSVWQFATSSLYNESIDNSILELITNKLDYENGCSTAITLQAFAASNENIRDSKYEVEGKDLIEVLFDNYYNKDKNEIEYTKGVENTYSANQVIASLMAYKVCRDTGKKANIYG